MKVGKMYERITIQKNCVVVDAIGNHKNGWEDYFSCYTYPSTYSADETNGEVQHERESITFSVRYSPEVAAVTATGYRILFHGQLYNIEAIDPMNYDRKEIKIRCTLEVRPNGK